MEARAGAVTSKSSLPYSESNGLLVSIPIARHAVQTGKEEYAPAVASSVWWHVPIGARMNEYWPPLVVRRWQGILHSRNLDNWFDWDHDPIEEAVISRPLHELRGLVVGQVAEIESLLLHVAQEMRDRYMGTLPGRQKRKGAGGALQDVRKLLAALALEDELSAELEKIGRVTGVCQSRRQCLAR